MNYTYSEPTLRDWVAAHVTPDTDLASLPLRELRARYREEIDEIDAEDSLLEMAEGNPVSTTETQDTVETLNAIRYYLQPRRSS